MKVTLLHNTPLHICSDAIRQCYDTHNGSDTLKINTEILDSDNHGTHLDFKQKKITGPKDKALINKIANVNKHASTIEHLVYSFDIDGISRGCLQQLTKHRMMSLTVKSTRYTLKELKDETSFIAGNIEDYPENAKKYIILTGEKLVDEYSLEALENLRVIISKGITNDVAKYCMPEAYKTRLSITINARSLQNLLELRIDKHAHWEIQKLAKKIYLALPDEHKYLFTQSMLRSKKKAEAKAKINEALNLIEVVKEDYQELFMQSKLQKAIDLIKEVK